MTTPLIPDTNFSLLSNESIKERIKEEYDLLYEVPVEIVVLLSIIYGGISIIAVIGNALVIWIVATTRQMHTVTNLYIANLALADVIIGMFCIPFQFQAALLQRWNLPEFMCAFCPFVQVVSVNVSVFTLTAIAVDRHRAIINPLRARPTKFVSKAIICSIWIASIAFAVPMAIALRVVNLTEEIRKDNVTSNFSRPFCENINLSKEQIQSYRYYLVIVQYVIPFCIISFVYIQMSVRLWGSRTPGNAQDARDITLLKNKKKVIKMLIIVVVVFGLCWLPLQTYNIIHVTWPEINEYIYINIIWFCCDWLAMSNSCYNPFIYGIYNEKFKREFNRRFSFCFCRFDTQDSADRTMSVYTRASSIRSNYTNSSTRFRNNVLMQHQQRYPSIKTTDGYNVITDLDNHHRTLVNNNRLIGNGDKLMWTGSNVQANTLENGKGTANVIADCICNPLGGDEWTPGEFDTDHMLNGNSHQGRHEVTLKDKGKAVSQKAGGSKFFSITRKQKDAGSCGGRGNLEMTDYCLLERSNGKTRENRSNVTFNNM